MRNRTSRTRRALVLVPLITSTLAASAETLNFGIDAGVGETDNVTLAHDDRISQTIAVTDADFDYVEKSRLLDVDAVGKFSYLDYLQNAYRSELLGRFDGSGTVALIPQRLTWSLQDDFGQAAIDPFTPTIPTNLENVNYVATGPDLHLRPGGASFVDASARVAETHYESSSFSNTRGTGSLAWGLNLSALSSVSINVATQRVLFEDTALNPDFSVNNVFGRYEFQGARGDLSAEVGDTIVHVDGKSTSGALARFDVTRKLSASAQISASLGHDSTDASASFANIQPGATGMAGATGAAGTVGGTGATGATGVISAAAAPNVSGTYSRTYGSVEWAYQRNRTTLGVSGRWEKDDYAGDSALNRTQSSAELRLKRQLRQAFSVQITGSVYKTDYGNVNLPASSGSPDTQTSAVRAALDWHPGRVLDLKLAIEHTSYKTAPYDTGYQDNRVFLTVGYRPSRAASGDIPSPAQ